MPFLLALLVLSGCASAPVDERDPLEPFNRQVYRFNDAFDRHILRPVAERYEAITPRPVNRGISNFFSNLGDINVIVNDLLQFKVAQAGFDLGRLTFNTTIGLLGFIDVATPMGLEKHDEDFGQTLGYWGVGTGWYLVLPFLGPSDMRDGAGLVSDYHFDPVTRAADTRTRWAGITLRAVDTRAGLLKASRVFEQAALDPYAFMRDAYFQRRENLVYDGNPPPPKFDFEDEPPEGEPSQ
jgi:phospholipid-binding lipoprotein MlaA